MPQRSCPLLFMSDDGFTLHLLPAGSAVPDPVAGDFYNRRVREIRLP